MINLLSTYVSHKKHGKGKVTEQSNTHIYVVFSNHEAKFQYPEAFEKFLTSENPNTHKLLLDAIKEKKRNSPKSFYSFNPTIHNQQQENSKHT